MGSIGFSSPTRTRVQVAVAVTIPLDFPQGRAPLAPIDRTHRHHGRILAAGTRIRSALLRPMVGGELPFAAGARDRDRWRRGLRQVIQNAVDRAGSVLGPDPL